MVRTCFPVRGAEVATGERLPIRPRTVWKSQGFARSERSKSARLSRRRLCLGRWRNRIRYRSMRFRAGCTSAAGRTPGAGSGHLTRPQCDALRDHSMAPRRCTCGSQGVAAFWVEADDVYGGPAWLFKQSSPIRSRFRDRRSLATVSVSTSPPFGSLSTQPGSDTMTHGDMRDRRRITVDFWGRPARPDRRGRHGLRPVSCWCWRIAGYSPRSR